MSGLLAKSENIYAAAESLQKSANHIDKLLNDFENLKRQVGMNYESESATKVLNSFEKVKQNGPEFRKAVEECSKYLSDTVAPNYEAVEKSTADSVG